MTNQAVILRTRKLGILIKDARLFTGKSLEQCAQVLGIAVEDMRAIEDGKKNISLPELEIMAYFLNVPLDHFWGNTVKSGEIQKEQKHDVEKIRILRNRIIGITLRKKRDEVNKTYSQLEEETGISQSEIEAYEKAEKSVPIPDLEILARALGITLRDFSEHRGPIGNWIAEQRLIQQLEDMPEEMQQFISKPINRPYLELAQRLSEMSVSKLREVAEGLLEITL